MATVKIPVSINTWTQVLDGGGFVYSSSEIEYNFSALSPIVDGFVVPPHYQVTGATGQILWAKSVGFYSAFVFSNTEA